MGFKLFSSGSVLGCLLAVLSVLPGGLSRPLGLDGSSGASVVESVRALAGATASMGRMLVTGELSTRGSNKTVSMTGASFQVPVLSLLAFQEPAAQEPEARPKPRRLPTYYSRVVTQKQREDIYAIQDKYEAEMEAIRQQLDAKMKERDAEIQALLTADQLAEVQRLTDEAKQRRSERNGTSNATEESDSGTSDGTSGDGTSNGSGQ